MSVSKCDIVMGVRQRMINMLVVLCIRQSNAGTVALTKLRLR